MSYRMVVRGSGGTCDREVLNANEDVVTVSG